jgi:hypothetical protein
LSSYVAAVLHTEYIETERDSMHHRGERERETEERERALKVRQSLLRSSLGIYIIYMHTYILPRLDLSNNYILLQAALHPALSFHSVASRVLDEAPHCQGNGLRAAAKVSSAATGQVQNSNSIYSFFRK